MSVSAARPMDARAASSFWTSLKSRQLDSYPDTGPRLAYLGLTVLITVALYYELYVGGSVSTLQLADLHMSFTFYVSLLAFGNLVGAFGSLFAGLADRVGRCNIVVAGLLVTGLLVTFAIPAATSKWVFGIEGWIVGLVEGICLVATPALIRDFSPQVGRGAAMGFWTMGPVLGSLVVSVVGAHTIHGTPPPAFWGHEYVICGVAGLVVFGLAFLFLRELSPGIRDQLMVTTRDRALVEMRAKGLDIEASLKNPFRQLLKAEVVISAFAISVFLLIYYTAVGFGTIYFETIFGFNLNQANGLGNWNWGINALSLVVIGLITDRFRVRKPFMVIGGVFAAVMMVVYLMQAGHHPSYYHVALLIALLSLGLGIAYTPWMASFTETVEARNPALTATGLAIWGWIIRVVIFASFLLLPQVINTVTPLVNFGVDHAALAAEVSNPTNKTELGKLSVLSATDPAALASVQRYAPELAFASSHPALIAGVTNPTNAAELGKLQALATTQPAELAAVQAHAADLATLSRFKPEVAAISTHTALFTQLAADPTNKALQAQAVAALGGGAKGVAELATLAANQKAITAALTFAAANPKVVAFATANASTLAWAASHSGLVAQATRYGTQLKALAAVPASTIAFAKANASTLAWASTHAALVADATKNAKLLAEVGAASKKSPGQWKTWYWICFAGMIVFLLSVPLLKGRWSPKAARADEEAHEAMVQAELAKLNA
jgi:MFS family permease